MARGRKTLYRDTYPTIAAALRRRGYTLDEVARVFGVYPQTIRKWANQHPDFDVALKETKDEADAQVEDSLLKRALGYDYTETEVYKSSTGGKKTVRVVEKKKHIPPNVTAMIFWLKNRRPDLWRDILRHELEGAKDGPPIEIKILGKDKLGKEDAGSGSD